ncbi:hypothetical protein B0H10DRAFT_2318631 [Mycena sp. CBHHK59/15]|nr:hypothetical protein B0H10DRAFT_2318631 [Mycena sp. CBHHK59/15]
MPSEPAQRHHGKTPKPRRARLTSKITPEQLIAIKEELKLLPGLIKTHYGKWTNGAQEFQLECMEAQKLGKDVILHASTGSGKTGIAAGPHLLPSSQGKVTLVVSPLLSLHEEQVVTFRDEFGLKATAINSANGGCTKPIMEVTNTSPAPIIAVTATLTPRVHQDLVTKLQFDPHNYVFCTIGNDRPNVSQIVRALEHPANSYRDLDFMVNEKMTKPRDVTKAFLYTDDIQDGGKIIDHLNARVCPAYRARGLVRPYNAGMSPKYRAEVMALFKAGIVRILVCTDAAGCLQGCDIPDIKLVVQWKLRRTCRRGFSERDVSRALAERLGWRCCWWKKQHLRLRKRKCQLRPRAVVGEAAAVAVVVVQQRGGAGAEGGKDCWDDEAGQGLCCKPRAKAWLLRRSARCKARVSNGEPRRHSFRCPWRGFVCIRTSNSLPAAHSSEYLQERQAE